ncbi:uncharacterized protein LOC127859591 [Dreissena polymorpha]|uniref:uncharacterized protein LOC127859591 n=1 Tax=Dreissena polymorpha TaxID=45954 RepID=UPI002264DFC9|nr:uncharacterized protein LOC127859591 [Dreissena polymorpha]
MTFTASASNCGVPFVDNAEWSGSSTTLGSNVTFTCNTSYVLQGNTTSTCQATGSWSPLPSCSYQCEEVAVIPNGKVAHSCLRLLQSCTVQISCNSTHDLIGQYNIICVPGGWSHEWPKCRPKAQLRGSLTSITLFIKPPSDEQGLKRFMDALGAELDDHFKTEMGSYYESVTVHSISSNGVANISFYIGNTDAATASFASSMAALIKGEPITVLNNKTRVKAATLESGQQVSLNQTEAEMSCAIYESIQGLCPTQTKCKYVDEKPVYDFALLVGLGVGIPLFLIAALVLGLLTYRMCRNRRKMVEDDDTVSSYSTYKPVMGPYLPAIIPTRYNPMGRPGPIYSNEHGWDNMSEIGRNNAPSDVEVSIGFEDQLYRSEQPSNFSWDHMYPRINERL